MTTPAKPKFYQPVFGNDNFLHTGAMGHDVVDIAAFTAPELAREDAAAKSPARLTEIA